MVTLRLERRVKEPLRSRIGKIELSTVFEATTGVADAVAEQFFPRCPVPTHLPWGQSPLLASHPEGLTFLLPKGSQALFPTFPGCSFACDPARSCYQDPEMRLSLGQGAPERVISWALKHHWVSASFLTTYPPDRLDLSGHAGAFHSRPARGSVEMQSSSLFPPLQPFIAQEEVKPREGK